MKIIQGLNFKAASFLREFILNTPLLQELVKDCAKDNTVTETESMDIILMDLGRFSDSLQDMNCDPYEVLDCIGDELADSAYPQMIVSNDTEKFTCYNTYVSEMFEISLVHVTLGNLYIGTSISRKSKLVYFVHSHDTLS